MPSGLGPLIKSVPTGARKNVYVHPWQLDISENAKFGKYPSMVQVKTHFPSVIARGYESEKEALEIKFTSDALGAKMGQELDIFSVRYIDGHCKGLMVQAVFALLIHLAPQL